MRHRPVEILALLMIVSISAGCNKYTNLVDIHNELLKKLDAGQVVAIAWDKEQKQYSSMPELQQKEFENSFIGKKVRTTINIREHKTGDMSLFQKSFAEFDYYTIEKFNFNKLMVVIGNGPNYNNIETAYVVFLPFEYFYEFNKGQVITVEGLIDSVSFTFYNCNIMLYPAKLISK